MSFDSNQKQEQQERSGMTLIESPNISQSIDRTVIDFHPENQKLQPHGEQANYLKYEQNFLTAS